jgi:hypothetical protein
VRNAACVSTIDTSVVITPVPTTWTGTTSTSWNTAGNWNCGAVPVVTDNVLIPTGTTYLPVIAGASTAYARNLTLAAGVTVTNQGSLEVRGNLNSNGTISYTGTVKLNGSSAQTVSGIAAVSNLSLENSAGATIATGARLTIKNTLGITAGTLTTNDSLVLYSDSLATARVTPLPAGAAITGTARVQQYIPGGMRRYRFWSHPFSNYIGLEQAQVNIDITGLGGASNGFTTTTSNSPSAFRYDPLTGNSSLGYDPGWKPFTSAYTTADSNRIHRFQGIRLYMRGAKGEGLGYPSYTPSPVTISQWGTLNQGAQTVPLQKGSAANQEYNMIGNPYASPVDIGTVCYNAKTSGNIVGGAFYIWNATLGSAGQFQAISIGTTTATPYYLPANNCFQVRAAHNGDTLNFAESNKGAVASASLFRSTGEGVKLMVYDNNYHPWDILDLNFNSQAGDEDDNNNDAAKLTGTDFGFYSVSSDNRKLAIDVRSFRQNGTVPLGISSNYAQDFIIRTEMLRTPDNSPLYLHDKLLNQYVQLQKGTEYKFTVSADKATQGDNRFELRMAPEEAATGNNLKVSLAPNPASDEVNITITASGKDDVSIRMTDIVGVQVYSKNVGHVKSGTTKVTLDKLASGIYMIEVKSGNNTIVNRLVKE